MDRLQLYNIAMCLCPVRGVQLVTTFHCDIATLDDTRLRVFHTFDIDVKPCCSIIFEDSSTLTLC